MVNLLGFLNPKQREQLSQLKAVGKRIKATISKEENQVVVRLVAEDEEAKKYLGAFTEAVCQSVAQALHMFDVTGEIVDRT